MPYYYSNRPRPMRPAAIMPGYRGYYLYVHTQNMFVWVKT